jgi:hypothetical protein
MEQPVPTEIVSYSTFNMAYLSLLGIAVAFVLLFFYHKREPTSTFGMTSLYLILGIFLNMQEVLAAVLPLKLGWGLEINPGSAVLFPANLLIVLLLYRTKTMDELKKLCIVLISVNVMIASVSYAMSAFVGSQDDKLLTKIFSLQSSEGVILSSVLLALDIIVVLAVYDKLEVAPLWVRLAGPLLASLWVDAVGYSALRWLIFGDPFRTAIMSHMICKTVAGLLYSSLFWAYLRMFEKDDLPSTKHIRGMATRFIYYFFNQLDYKELRKEIFIDRETGFHLNLQEALANHLKESRRSGQPVVSLYMFKILHYKQCRDRFLPEHYEAMRRALSQVAELVYVHDKANGTLALLFLRDIDVRNIGIELHWLLNMQEDDGLYGRVRRWPTETGRLDLIDAWASFDPKEQTYLKASALISSVTLSLMAAEYEYEPPASDTPRTTRKDILRKAGFRLNLREELAKHLKELRASGKASITLYMFKIRDYERIEDRLRPEHYEILRRVLSLRTEMVYLHDSERGTLALVFFRDIDVRELKNDLRWQLNEQVAIGSQARHARWPTATGLLDFVDAWASFDSRKSDVQASAIIDLLTRTLTLTVAESLPYTANANPEGRTALAGSSVTNAEEHLDQKARDIIELVTSTLTAAESEYKPPAPIKSGPMAPSAEMIGEPLSSPPSTSDQPQTLGRRTRRRAARRPAAPAQQVATSPRSVVLRKSQATAPEKVTNYQGFVEAVEDGIAYLNLEDEKGRRIEIEWDANELAEKGIFERAPFLLTIREFEDRVKFRFRADKSDTLSEQTRSEIHALLSHYESTGELDG